MDRSDGLELLVSFSANQLVLKQPHSHDAPDEHTYCWRRGDFKGILSFPLKNAAFIRSIGVSQTVATLIHARQASPRAIRVWGEPANDQRSPSTQVQERVLVPLALIEYDTELSTREQNFTTGINENIIVQKVIIEVLSNWGDPQRTCICSLHIYGSSGES
jgi:hypothetical protein